MDRKIVVITGANQGIGFESARRLVRKSDLHVVITARDEERGQMAIDKIREETPQANIELMILDLDDDESLEAFVEDLSKKFSAIYCLVNNAGHGSFDADAAKAEATMKTNFFQTVKLTDRMLPLLQKFKNARVVTVASETSTALFNNADEKLKKRVVAPGFTTADIWEIGKEYVEAVREGPPEERGLPGFGESYFMSKLCVRQYFQAFAQEHPELVVATCCPGWCHTNLGGETAPRKPEDGAEIVEYIVSQDLDGKSGEFWQDSKISPRLQLALSE
mmetsp:Transcript_19520/g.38192  ORF Transcript_19520/g.38192 Transcript_19520/m.38192 type:complete len:277 (-) Transcript_19520:99-929(-)|eukprot:CAMPEP_0171568954 /NCGR_PEP_ID=MMETSP0961-20121227/2070_1 /TAXON_ID=87120 /ORGANISM="Aurantiochytrium limacinum, Strain ATCCMYA-1381" /LENGTH=276 /DNA_ID=CAMNT_0012123179 /DNA_START=49 /DNA_END=879 /DNA_ORIENTATION=-